jgi:O-antigen/teichoic acid export membrane protein
LNPAAPRPGILKSIGVLAIGQVAAQLLNVWALVFLAGRLGAHWFGVVQVGVAFMAYALVIAEWGFFSLGIRETARLDDDAEVVVYARRHTGLLAVQAAAVTAVGLLAMPWLPFATPDAWIFRGYLAMAPVQVFMLSWLAAGREQMTLVGATKAFRSLAYALLVLLLFDPLNGLDAMPAARWVPLLFLAANVAGNIMIGGAVRRRLGRWILPTTLPWAEARRRWREAGHLGAGVLVLRILLNVDLMVLGSLAAPEAAGNYAAASRLIFLLVVAMEVFWTASLPRFSRLAATDSDAFRRTLNRYLGLTLAALLPISVGGALVGPDLVALLYRGEFAAGGDVFRILAVSYGFLAVGTFLGNTLVAEDRQRAYVGPLVAAAIVAVVGTALLVPSAGAVGAARGMLAAHVLLALLLVASQWPALKNGGLGRVLLRLLPALAVMTAVAMLGFSWPVVARIAAAGAAYVLLAARPVMALVRPGARTPGAPA